MSTSLGEAYCRYHEKNRKYGFSHHLSTKKKFLQKEIKQGSFILDLGSRDGELTASFLQGNNVICVDIDPKAIELCQENLGIQAICHDLNNPLPFGDEMFDIVVMADILEHVFFAGELLAEVNRVLKIGGILIGSSPNAFYWTNRLKMFWGIDLVEYIDSMHVKHFSKESLERSIRQSFLKLEIIPYGKHPLAKLWPKVFASDLFWRAYKL